MIVVIGAAWDVRTNKIPNLLNFPAAVVGLILNACMYGVPGAVGSIFNWCFGAAIMIGPHPKNKIGFGDVKLVAAIGALLGGAVDLLMVFFYFCLCYGVISMGFIISRIPWKDLLGMIISLRAGKVPAMPKVVTEARKKAIPIGPAIAAATFLGILLKEQTKHFFTGS